jgi:uncharacterized protein YndB with AHSA1/START domain
MTSTRVSRHINAPRASVYRALVDAHAIPKWMVPTGMTGHVHAFEARPGGAIRFSLAYDAPTGAGKTTAQVDTYHGRFLRVVPNERVVEVVEFETADPALQGEMTITITLADVDGGTDVVAVHDGLPPGLLVGLDAIAVDMHVRRFVRETGLAVRDPEDIEALLTTAGQALGLTAGEVDELVWRSMALPARR